MKFLVTFKGNSTGREMTRVMKGADAEAVKAKADIISGTSWTVVRFVKVGGRRI